MNTSSNEVADVATATETLRPELERLQRELEACQLRLGELEQGEALLAGENRLLQMVAKGEALPSILDGICRLVEEVSSGSLCSILLLDANGDRLWHGAAPSLPASYIGAFAGRAIGPRSGPCGRAVYFGKAVIVCDIAADPLGDDYRDLALAHGLQACWSTPIFSSEGKVLGSFAVLSREPRSPTPQHEKIIAQVAHLAAVAIERKRTEQELRRSEAYLAEAQRLSLTGSFGWNVSTGEIIWSKETYRILGYDGTMKPNLNLVLERVPPEDRGLVQKIIDRATRDGTDLDFGHRLLMPDRTVKHVHVVARATKAESGAIEFIGAVMDVTEQKRAEALVAGEKELLEMIARGSSLASVLDTLCRFGEEMCGNVLVSILLLSPDGKSLRHGAAPRLPRSYTEAIDGALIGPRAGSCGTAAYRAERVIVSDIATDPLWDQYRHLAIPHGLRACWSTPILSTAREVMGTFALYSREPGSPSSEQLNLIEQMTHLAAVAIERRRAEEALRHSESRFEGILAIADDAIISVDSKQRIVLFNQGAEKVFGYTRSEIIGKPLDILLPERFADAHREHIGSFAKSSDVSRTMGQRREVFGRRKDGGDFPAEASISKLDHGGELVFTVILRDVTERKRAEEMLRRSEADLYEAQRLTHMCSWKHDIASGKVLVSPEVYRIFDIQPSEDASDPGLFFGRILPEDRQRIQELFSRCEQERIPYQADYRIVLSNGTIRHQHAVGHPVLNETGDLVEFVGTAIDVTEQREAQEALRASEHLARGQLDALAHTLDAMAQESEPDKLLEHALRTIAEQSGAHSVSVWVRNDDGNRLERIAVIEDGRFVNIKDATYFGLTFPSVAPHHPVWRDVFRTRQHAVLEDLECESVRMCVGSGPDEIWHRVLEDTDPDPEIAALKKYLRGLGVRTILFVPMLIAGEVAGIVGIRLAQKRSFRREEIELTRALAHQAMLAIQLMRLSQQSREAAVVAERNRMARDIHDTLAQGFTGVIMQLEAAKGATTQGNLAEIDHRIERASDLARSSLGEARRSVRALRPRSLRDGKLFLAIDDLFKRMTEGTSLNADFQAEGDDRSLPADCEEGLLRITQEALTNAVKHANARNFRATLSVGADKIHLRLVDDGRGFDPKVEHEGFGLIGMKERVDRMNGQFIIRAKPDVGTEILVELKNQPTPKPENQHEQS